MAKTLLTNEEKLATVPKGYEAIRMADDACLFCGKHGEYAGGHLFIGKRQQDGSLLSDAGWICIEHLATCAIQICPKCTPQKQEEKG